MLRLETLLDLSGDLDAAATDGPTGFFGSRLDAALRTFQKRHGLKPDGLVTPRGPTLSALKRTIGVSAMPPRPATPPIQRSLLRSAAQSHARTDAPLPSSSDALPLVTGHDARVRSLLEDAAARFEVGENPDADGSPPWHEWPDRGTGAIERHDSLIDKLSRKHGVDPDLVRAVMWAENARGHKLGLDPLADTLRVSKRPLPMNIDKNMWPPLTGKNAEDFYDAQANIEAGVVLIRRIAERLSDPTPAKIGTLWHYTGALKVSDFGAYIQKVFDSKPWDNNDK